MRKERKIVEKINLTEKNPEKDSKTKNVKKLKSKEQLESELKGYDRIIGYSGIMLALILPVIHNEMIDQPEKSSAFMIAFVLTGIYILLLFVFYYLRSKEKTKLLALNFADTISIYCPVVFVIDIAFIFLSRTPINEMGFLALFSSVILALMLGLTYILHRVSKKQYEN